MHKADRNHGQETPVNFNLFFSTRFQASFDVERKSKNILEKAFSNDVSHFSSKLVFMSKNLGMLFLSVELFS